MSERVVRRICLFLLPILAVIILCGGISEEEDLLESVTVYVSEKVEMQGISCIPNGETFLCRVPKELLASFLERAGEVEGVTVRFHGDIYDAQSFLKELNAREVSRMRIEDRLVITAFSEAICEPILLRGELVNIQLAVFDEVITVGFPLILGSW